MAEPVQARRLTDQEGRRLQHNLTKRAGVPASRLRLASDGASWLACQK
jgi:hypothetical protein